jgi:uncharacterized coiled-coil DUF342 family protein
MSNESDATNGKLDMLTQKVDALTQNVDALTQNMIASQQNAGVMQQNINALREDMSGLRQRMDSFEGTMITVTREGFQSLRNYLDDLNYEVADNGRATRLLRRRVARLERKDED